VPSFGARDCHSDWETALRGYDSPRDDAIAAAAHPCLACPPRYWSGAPTSLPPSARWPPQNEQIGIAKAAFFPTLSIQRIGRTRKHPLVDRFATVASYNVSVAHMGRRRASRIKSVSAICAPRTRSGFGKLNHRAILELSSPTDALMLKVGKKAALAIPICSFAAAIWRSAAAMSGRRSNSAEGTLTGMGGGGDCVVARAIVTRRAVSQSEWQSRARAGHA